MHCPDLIGRTRRVTNRNGATIASTHSSALRLPGANQGIWEGRFRFRRAVASGIADPKKQGKVRL